MTDYMNMPGIPKGSYAAGERVKIPAGAEPPYTVFINGVVQTEGEDFNVEGDELVFTRPIVKEEMGTSRWLAMYLGLWGTYRKDEKVDIQFQRDGKTEHVADLDVVPYPGTEGKNKKLDKKKGKAE
ncbi:MAG: hypothetical protein JST59_16255 [Actinobacteria bacterium]|nr:hypothetical protein [Actinomycetota bacterium]